jgi:hypothetical protein
MLLDKVTLEVLEIMLLEDVLMMPMVEAAVLEVLEVTLLVHPLVELVVQVQPLVSQAPL